MVAQLKKYFSKFGRVISAYCIKNAATGRYKGFGFVEYESVAVAKRVSNIGKFTVYGVRVTCCLYAKRQEAKTGGSKRKKKGRRKGRRVEYHRVGDGKDNSGHPTNDDEEEDADLFEFRGSEMARRAGRDSGYKKKGDFYPKNSDFNNFQHHFLNQQRGAEGKKGPGGRSRGEFLGSGGGLEWLNHDQQQKYGQFGGGENLPNGGHFGSGTQLNARIYSQENKPQSNLNNHNNQQSGGHDEQNLPQKFKKRPSTKKDKKSVSGGSDWMDQSLHSLDLESISFKGFEDDERTQTGQRRRWLPCFDYRLNLMPEAVKRARLDRFDAASVGLAASKAKSILSETNDRSTVFPGSRMM